MKRVINYAHRGASACRPENTMAAFNEAIALGATGIETDIHMTKNGRLVLIHDETLTRTTGVTSFVKDMTFEEIKKIDAGSLFNTDYCDQTIPALEELLELVRQTDIVLNLELKSAVVLYPNIEAQVVKAIRQYDMAERVIISSYNHYSLVDVKRLAPEIQTGILYMAGLYEPWNYAKTIGASALHAIHFAVIPELVAEAKQHGIIYNPYTVNNPEEMKRLIHAGVDGIITDYPDRLTAILSGTES